MIHSKLPLAVFGLGCLGSLAFLASLATGGEAPVVRTELQNPPNNVRKPALGQFGPRQDRGKGAVEMPTKLVVAAKSAPVPAAPASTTLNPKVEPGKVRWHDDLAAASAASARSHKPVLLFQMMGKLDEQFC